MVEENTTSDEDKCRLCRKPVPETPEGYAAVCPGCLWKLRKPKCEPPDLIQQQRRPKTLRRREE